MDLLLMVNVDFFFLDLVVLVFDYSDFYDVLIWGNFMFVVEY